MNLVFLSPHHDDAVLSCGGLIARLNECGFIPTVLTVFGGNIICSEASPKYVQGYVSLFDAATPQECIEIRRQEDRLACEVLGAQRQDLPFPDAGFRASGYVDWEAITGKILPEDADLHLQIAQRVDDIAGRDALLFCPLSVGAHVDHRIVRQAGEHLASLKRAVVFYEDFPYCAQGHDVAALTGALMPASVEVEKQMERKLHAITRYASQLDTMGGTGPLRDLAHTYFRRGTANATERYWANPDIVIGSFAPLLLQCARIELADIRSHMSEANGKPATAPLS